MRNGLLTSRVHRGVGVVAGCLARQEQTDVPQNFYAVAILYGVGLALTLYAILARIRVIDLTLVLEIVSKLVDDQTRSESVLDVSVLLIDIDDVCIIIPTDNIALLAATDVLNKEFVLLKPDFGHFSRHRVSRQMRCPTQKNRQDGVQFHNGLPHSNSELDCSAI